MTTAYEVRDALVDILGDSLDLRASRYPSDKMNTPCAFVDIDEYDPRMVFGADTATYPFRVYVYYGRLAERSVQERIDRLRAPSGSGSLTAAVRDEANWPDQLIHYCSVTRIGRPMITEIAGEQLFVVEFDLEVVF